MAVVHITASDETGLVPGAVRIYDLEGKLTTEEAVEGKDIATMPLAWSPDGKSLAYLEFRCPPREKCESTLILIGPDARKKILLVSTDPAFMDVNWQDAATLLLADEGFQLWRYSLPEGRLEKRPRT